MSQKRRANLYFSTHGDCFVHGFLGEWSGWLKISTEQLYLVRIVFPKDYCLIATFSQRPALPSNMKKAKFYERGKYLEIDPEYAKCLPIKEGEEVMVECIPELAMCGRMVVIPDDTNDYEILECNKEKIENDLINQVRVVSAKHCFPIWINGQPIFLRLLSSQPPAIWVLLVKNTYIDLQVTRLSGPSSAVDLPSLPSSPPPTRSDSSQSEESSHTTISNFSSVSHQNPFPLPRSLSKGDLRNEGKKITHHRSSKSDISPMIRTFNSQGFMCKPPDDSPSNEEPDPIDNPVTQIGRTLLSSFTNIFRSRSPEPDQESTSSTNSKTRSQKMNLLSPQEEEKPLFKQQLPLSQSYTHGSGPRHVRGGSLPSDFDRVSWYIKEVGTTKMKAVLRIQPINLSALGKSWGIDCCFHIFVHPLSLPDVYHKAYLSHTPFLVKLTLLYPPSKDEKLVDNKMSDTANPSSVPTPSPDPSQTESTQASFFNRLTSIFDFPDRISSSPIPPTATPTTTDQPSTYVCKVVLAQMHIATTLRFVKKNMFSSAIVVEEGSLSREGSTSPTHASPPFKPREPQIEIPILPGHVIMSDFLRQQLGARVNSYVLIRHVTSDRRIDCQYNKVTINFQPLETNNSIKWSRPDVIFGFKQWIGYCHDNHFGCVFANNMIVPIPLNRSTKSPPSCTSSDLLMCRVFGDKDYSMIEAPLKFFQFYQQDVNKVDVGIGKLHRGVLMSLNDLESLVLDIRMEQFGAIKELFSNSYRQLLTSFSQSYNGAILICGTGGGGAGAVASGCGKTSLARLLCKEASQSYWKFHIIEVDCTLLRGKRTDIIKKRLKEILQEAIHHQPAIILLDDLDEMAKHITDVQKEASGEALVHTRNAQVVVDFIAELQCCKAVVIATASSKQLLHPCLLHSKGRHIFSVIEITPPNLIMRQEMIGALLQTRKMKSVLLPVDIRAIALKTEGFQVKDLAVLVDKAMSCAEQRSVQHSITRESCVSVSDPLSVECSPQTPAKKDSNSTLVPKMKQMWSSYSPILHIEDFWKALKTYLPSALKGLSLHSGGTTNFKRVGGLDEAKKTLQETLLWPSKYPRLFKACPIKQHAGVLLYGAPGTGKTLLAEAVANEFCLNFVSIKGPELLNKYIGASEQAVRDLFARAQAAQPCILFFDEFDSLAPRRGHDRTGVTDRVVNQLLTQLDGVESSQGIYVLAASSRPDLIDPALLRPGRVDKILFCNIPSDEEERCDILKALCHDLPIDNDINFEDIANATANYTGADLKALLYNAQLLAVNRILDKRHTKIELLTKKNWTTHSDVSKVEPSSSEGSEKLLSHSLSASVGNHSEIYSTKTQSAAARHVWQFHKGSDDGILKTRPSTEIQPLIEEMLKQNHSVQSSDFPSDKYQFSSCVITQADLMEALHDTKPSLSPQERQKYENIYKKFKGGGSPVIPNQRATLA